MTKPPSRMSRTAPPTESEATKHVLAERQRRADQCLAEIQQALHTNRCAFQVVVQDTFGPGTNQQRSYSVNVTALEVAAAPVPNGNGL